MTVSGHPAKLSAEGVAVAQFQGVDRRGTRSLELRNSPLPTMLISAVVAGAVLLAAAPSVEAIMPAAITQPKWPISAASGVIGLAAIVVWFAVWLLSGRAWPAYVGLALVPSWAIAEFAGTPSGAIVEHTAAIFLALLPPVAGLALLRLAAHSAEIDTAFRPLRILAALAASVAAALTAASLLVHEQVHASRIAVAVVGLAVVVAWVALAGLCRRSPRFDPASRQSMTLVMLLLGLAAADCTVGLLDPHSRLTSFAFSCGRLVAVLGWCLALAAAVRALHGARAIDHQRQRTLKVSRDAVAHSLSEQGRLREERRHDLRSLIAGIQSATATLTRYRDFLEPAERQYLESALIAEISRLQNAISVGPRPPQRFSVREALTPVIAAERARGAVVATRLVDAEAVGDAGSTAALLQNLLTNARRHAPGATITVLSEVAPDRVTLSVADDGPGLPAVVRRRVMSLLDGDDGSSFADTDCTVAVPSTPADAVSDLHGLGLAICVRLAREQGGELRLAQTERGTRFELELPLMVAELVSAP